MPTPKNGREPLHINNQPIGKKLLDFWCWSASNLISNATRGVLAEFIVATAIGMDIQTVREEWSPYDLTSPEGIKIEVKSSAYLQTWQQKGFSKIVFSIGPALFWDSATNIYETVARRCSDVYIFCLLHCQAREILDPLNMDQWTFYVVPTAMLNDRYPNQKTISLKVLQQMTAAVDYGGLREVVQAQAGC